LFAETTVKANVRTIGGDTKPIEYRIQKRCRLLCHKAQKAKEWEGRKNMRTWETKPFESRPCGNWT